jgi:NAD(P)H dehydrogenase (quinone)
MTSTDGFVGVIGASGQLGMLAADKLMQRVPPEKLALLSRAPAKLEAFTQAGAQVRFCDLDCAADLPVALCGVVTLLLISTNALGRRVTQHAAAIEASRQAGVKRIVYTSFLGADLGNPALVARDHCATESLLRASGLEWTILRNAQYSDAILDVIMPNALVSGEWLSSSGEGRIAPVAREDCAECAVAALLREDAAGRIFSITGPDLLRYCVFMRCSMRWARRAAHRTSSRAAFLGAAMTW